MNLEYRLYYDDTGKPITYTMEKLPGKYIVITREQYALCDWNVKVVNDQIVSLRNIKKITKLEKSDTGVKAAKYDVNILLEDDDNVEHNYWTVVTHEYHR